MTKRSRGSLAVARDGGWRGKGALLLSIPVVTLSVSSGGTTA
jgi:hypothetical protein